MQEISTSFIDYRRRKQYSHNMNYNNIMDQIPLVFHAATVAIDDIIVPETTPLTLNEVHSHIDSIYLMMMTPYI